MERRIVEEEERLKERLENTAKEASPTKIKLPDKIQKQKSEEKLDLGDGEEVNPNDFATSLTQLEAETEVSDESSNSHDNPEEEDEEIKEQRERSEKIKQ